ncbi:LysR family transcriptional regulator ArgP [Bacterioplanoides sp.]|uniref:LysR family transcriptional regulator ArgP n=1 Tax=Bacterioplanoides sp. TaxID=2066072 RepID=UPI003AFFEFBB
MMDYRALEALSAVIEHAGFEKAAQVLNISQSAVSQRIRQLEFKLGQPVLLRTSPPRLTELGRQLSNHLQQVKQLEQGLRVSDEPTAELNIRLAVNADSIDTWLAPALAACRDSQRMNFDLVIEDQRVGLKRMKNGEVMACICESAQPVNGGLVQKLGTLRYMALASPEFIARYRGKTQGHQWLQQAPCLRFSGDDQLQHQFLQALQLDAPGRIQRVPSSGGFVQMALAGLGFGMIPEIQVKHHLAAGELINVTPDTVLDVPLYWHYWQTESDSMAQLRHASAQQAARALLPL